MKNMWDTSLDKKFVVVAYDIVETKSRTKLMKLLKGNGEHVQKSVFECLLDREQIDTLVKKIELIIDPEKDTVRLYIFEKRQVEDIEIVGIGEVYEPQQLTLL